MNWLERYLQAVRKYLPWERQDDIIAELRANLGAQLEEREGELGRGLTEGELMEWLKELGPPMVMASRYQPARYLIGPNLFGLYWMVLRLALMWASVAVAVGIVARAVAESHGGDWAEWVVGQFLGYPNVWLLTAGWVTLSFAVAEYVATRNPEKSASFFATAMKWNPAKLAAVKARTAGGGKVRNLWTAVAEFVVQAAVLVWLLLIPKNPFLLMGPGAAFLHNSPVILMPVVLWFYWGVVGLTAVQVAWQGYLLLAEEWRVKSTAQIVITKALGLVPLGILLAAPGGQYVAANPWGRSLPAGLELGTLNHYVWIAVVVMGGITMVQIGVDIWKATSEK